MSERTFYDFAVALKQKHQEIKDMPEGAVSYSLQYIPWLLMVTAETYNKHHKYYDFNELLSVAFAAAVEAETKYEPERNKFSTYAKYHVEPALNDFVSNMTKNQLDLQKRVQNFIDGYFKINDAYPSEEIILSTLKITQESFRALTQAVDLVYIDDEDEDVSIQSLELTPEQSALFEDYYKALDYIDVDNNGILRLKIIEDLSFNIIAKKLNITKVKAQQLYDKAVDELREELKLRGFSKEDLS